MSYTLTWVGHVNNSLSPHNKHFTFYKWTFSEMSYMQVYSYDHLNGFKAKYIIFVFFMVIDVVLGVFSKWYHYVITLISLTRCYHYNVVITIFNTLNLHRREGLRGTKGSFYETNVEVLSSNNDGIWAFNTYHVTSFKLQYLLVY